MTNTFELHAELRHDLGKGASRRLRRQHDKIPAIMYGGKAEAVSLMLDHNKVKKSLENEAFYSHLLAIHIDGKKETAILKNLQRHPVKPIIMHMDFQRVSPTDKIHVRVPLHFSEAEHAPGVEQGGVVSHQMADVEIVCMAKDLPEYIAVDISNMALNQVIHLSDLKCPNGVEILALTHGAEHDQPVVSIHLPRSAEAVEEMAAENTATEEDIIKTDGASSESTDQ